MKRLVVFIPVLLAALLGCSVKLIDVKAEIPDLKVREKLPLRAVLLIPDSSLSVNSVSTLSSGCVDLYRGFSNYPFGNVFQEVSQGVFSQMFEHLEVRQSPPTRLEYDIVLEAKFDGMSHRWGCGHGDKGFFRAEGSLRLLNPMLSEFWTSERRAAEKEYEMGMTGLDPDRMSAVLSRGASGSISDLVNAWAGELRWSLVLEKYVKSRRATPPPVAEDRVRPAAAAVMSDVDVLPETRVSANGDAYAVIIGIEDYRQKLPGATFARRDARSMREYLTKVLGYPEENVILLVDQHAAKSDFEKYFEKWLPDNASKGSTVFVYFSGHGAPNPTTGDAYLVPYDGDPSFIDQTGYSLRRLYGQLARLQAREVVVALDSCFSGAGGRSVIAPGTRPLVMQPRETPAVPAHTTVLAAAASDQTSAAYDEMGHGLFTYFLLKGIKENDVVRSDGSLVLNALYAYVKPQVQTAARRLRNIEQTPRMLQATR